MKIEQRELIAEFIGSAFLTIAAISPMILFNSILKSEIGLAVMADALAVAFVLTALIETFGPVSGAHFNPVVSWSSVIQGKIKRTKALHYMGAQILGGTTGLILTHGMFYHQFPTILHVSTIQRNGGAYLGEILGTFILLIAIFSISNNNIPRIASTLGLLVGGQLMVTSSTMFANPMITIVRTLTYSVAGIHPLDAAGFIFMQLTGMYIANFTWNLLKEENQ